MSTDEKVAKDLVETLKDGRAGFTEAASRLRDSDRPEVAATMQRLADQRAGFVEEIVGLGHEYGDEVDESGSAGAAVHRGQPRKALQSWASCAPRSVLQGGSGTARHTGRWQSSALQLSGIVLSNGGSLFLHSQHAGVRSGETQIQHVGSAAPAHLRQLA